MKQYLDIVRKIIDAPDDAWKGNRTGVRAKSISGEMFKHNMADGFPLITTKQTFLRLVAVELEFFIKGLTDKKWLIDRDCHIWDEWACPQDVERVLRLGEYNSVQGAERDKLKKEIQAAQPYLGPIYGSQWRNFSGVDQLKKLTETLITNPSDRRMIVSAWNPVQLHEMALPPCHLMFQVIVTGEKYDTLNLNWYQRSVDTMLGLPFNIASYALLLKLLARHAKMKEGYLCGMLGDVHIYENQMETAKIQAEREPLPLPQVELPESVTDIFQWESTDYVVKNYQHCGKLEYPIAV